MPSADAAWHGGMEAVVELDQWQEVLARNPRNRARFLAMDRQEFLDVMDRWMLAYCPCDDSLVPGLDDADVARLDVPILVFRSGVSDMSHTRATSEALAAGLPGAELVEPPWGDDEWNERRGRGRARRGRSSSAGRCSSRSSSSGPTGRSAVEPAREEHLTRSHDDRHDGATHPRRSLLRRPRRRASRYDDLARRRRPRGAQRGSSRSTGC